MYDSVADQAFAGAMKALHQKYPDDEDAATIYAEALFVLEPRRGARDITLPAVQRAGPAEGLPRALEPRVLRHDLGQVAVRRFAVEPGEEAGEAEEQTAEDDVVVDDLDAVDLQHGPDATELFDYTCGM